MMREPSALVGFADSGAHIRNMAFYSFPLRMLAQVRQAEQAGKPIMPIEKAVWRLTGEIADWLDVDAGHLRLGDRADLVVVDPRALDERLAEYHEAPMEGLGGLVRMVNRSDGTVRAVLVNGRMAFEGGAFDPSLGCERGFGRFLPAGVPGLKSGAGDPRKVRLRRTADLVGARAYQSDAVRREPDFTRVSCPGLQSGVVPSHGEPI
jgi:N-acyl-D-glutamate deacylase